jgi:hypothetical protein
MPTVMSGPANAKSAPAANAPSAMSAPNPRATRPFPRRRQ